jgi:hypothetical protein
MRIIINFILKFFLQYIFSIPLVSYLVLLSLIYWDKKYFKKAIKLTDEIAEESI